MSYIVNLTGVQPTLVSGENIKTINGETILGSGDLTIDKTDVGLGNVDNTSDADKPISTATQTALDNKADLVGGKVPSSQIPAIAISEFLGAVNSQAAMLALLGQEGDWCIRTDVDLTYILIGTDPTDIDNWQEIVTPTSAVTSVNGYTGVVVLDQNDIGLGNVDDTSDLNKPISTATQTALNAKQDSLVSGTNIKTLEGQSLLGSGNIDLTKSDVGLSNVDNTSDLNKPISTATQTALNGKFNNPTGTSAQYIDGTGALQTFPTILDAGSLITEVYNNTGATLTKGTIVYINGGQGNLPTITKANASADATSAQTFGWVRNDITNNNNGYVIVAGKLSDLNTNGLGTGTQLYLSGTTSGAYTITKPQAPIHLVYVGVVVRDHPTQGVIEVKIQNGYEVDELHDVQIASIANNQVLQYESSTQLWKNKSLTTASVAASTDKNYVTDAQQVVIGNTSGTNTGDETQATIQSKLGTASTSTSGYLTSTDWNTFNGKQNALTLTTTGTSGAATLVGSTLNIPNYASGGLTYFTEAQSTAAPNATVNVDSLTAVASTANADFVIRPKGSGAILVQIPDGTATGGNKRGANAIDLQRTRNVASQVASGPGSILIGDYSTSSGTTSISIGSQNISNGTYTIAIGSGNTASNNQSTCVGYSNSVTGANWGHCFGQSNTVGGTYGTAVGYSNNTGGSSSISCGAGNVTGLDYSRGNCSTLGANNRAEESNSTAIGVYAGTFGVQGRQAYSNGRFSTTGDSQKGLFVLRIATTNNTATTLTTNSGAASTNNQVILSNQSAYRFKGTIIGKQSASTNVCAWDVDGLIVRGANAAATTLVVGNVNLVSNTPSWGTPILAADTTNGGLIVQVTGLAATNIQWTAVIETTEVIYA